MTAAGGGQLQTGVKGMTGDGSSAHLQPPTWNESHFLYPGDLTPKPTWEIIVKVSYTFCHHHHRRHRRRPAVIVTE